MFLMGFLVVTKTNLHKIKIKKENCKTCKRQREQNKKKSVCII